MKYEFITYDKLNEYLNELTRHKYKNQVIKQKPLAYSPCGFPVEHYSIGSGKKHLTIIAGTHGTEIIGIDFIVKLMYVIAKGEGVYKNFDEDKITLDFIPCQNPEGFIVVTEALRPYIDKLTEKEFEKLSEEYYLNYRKDDRVYLEINKLLSSIDENNKNQNINNFWNKYRLKEITKEDILSFCKTINNIPNIQTKIDELFQNLSELGISDNIIPKEKFHYKMFPELSYKNIPEKDSRYILLKNKVKKIMETEYNNYTFPKESLIDWRSNSNGVDLNKNNPNNFNIKNREKIKNNFQPLFGRLRFVSLMREVPGPQGNSSVNTEGFTFEPENIGLLKHLLNLRKKNEYLGALSYHGTGGVIYSKPLNYLDEKNQEKSILLKDIDNINDALACSYQKFTDYNIMPYPKLLSGTGDMIRQMLPGFLIIELSKMGGNPLGPYGDKEDNYKKVINTNLLAFHEILNVVENKIKIK